eukprot:TRINITY_DN473_c0_g1_i2.p2 TRINITY_DN473_c0_g1~~TRINITY_DN473_c0_g1_i2.p2  ORF type:complete len:279 (-),score=51.90 TRINITY_DN473_c0_g1_i2:686-1522(-)
MVSTVPTVPTNFILAAMWLSWLLFAVYVFGMPVWSKIFMDDLGYWKELCFTPAEDIVCGDGQDYMEIAKRLGRQRNGTYVGCGCGEGILGDWVCPVNLAFEPVNARTFSISYFMGTPNATGLLAALTFIPLLSIWVYGFWLNPVMAAAARAKVILRQGLNEACAFNFLFYTQVAFQLFLAAFLFFTFCSFPKEHELFVELFTLSEIVHFFGIAYPPLFSSGLLSWVCRAAALIRLECCLCKLLVDAKSDPNVVDIFGRNPAEMAADNMQHRVEMLLGG